ncbi:hypothetical protein HYW94_00430 [Candidatus Uhrbacteria bacterium]|nr:hypothetical protein [Candidatus Uhrbacteria bacterium]
MKKIMIISAVASLAAACYTDQKAPTAAEIFPIASPTPSATPTPVATPSATPTPVATPSATPTTPTYTPTPALPATSSTEVGDMGDDGNRNIVIQNYLVKAIVSPFPVTGWDANRVFAELSSGSVKPYVAGSFLGSPGWTAPPQDPKYYGSLTSGNLIIPIPTDSDIDGGNIAFAASASATGSPWVQVAWSSSQGPRNYLFYYGTDTKFRWSGWKLIRK